MKSENEWKRRQTDKEGKVQLKDKQIKQQPRWTL